MIRTAADACPGTRLILPKIRKNRINEIANPYAYTGRCLQKPVLDFPHKYSQKRCVEYRKLNLDGKWIEVLLNCGGEAD